jgi:hypothetical protein
LGFLIIAAGGEFVYENRGYTVVSWDVIPTLGLVGFIAIPFAFIKDNKIRLISAYVWMVLYQILMNFADLKGYAKASIHGGIFGTIFGFSGMVAGSGVSGTAVLVDVVREHILEEIGLCKGVVTSMGEGMVVSYFTEANLACQAVMRIKKNMDAANIRRSLKEKINLRCMMNSEEKKFMKGEMMLVDVGNRRMRRGIALENRNILDDTTRLAVMGNFHVDPLPEVLFADSPLGQIYYELVCPVNFLSTAEVVLKKFVEEEDERRRIQQHLEEELRKQKKGQRNPTAVAYAQALDNLGKILKNDLNEVNKYLLKRSSDKELINTVSKMLANSYKRFIVEVSKIIVE